MCPFDSSIVARLTTLTFHIQFFLNEKVPMPNPFKLMAWMTNHRTHAFGILILIGSQWLDVDFYSRKCKL